MATFDASGLQNNEPDWLKDLPSFVPKAAPQGNPLVAGFSSGLHSLYGDVGGLAQAAGTAVGLQPVADWGKSVADSQKDLSSQRPDLEFGQGELPWYSPSKLAYNVGKAVPGIGGAILAGAAVPEAAVPAWLARVGEAAPGIVGGGEGLGRSFGKSIIGAGAAFLPGSVAGNVNQEEQANQGQPISRAQAVAAIGLGLPEAAMAGMFPASIGKAGGAGLPAKILQGAGVGAAVNSVQSGLSTALSSFLGDPDKPIAQRAQDVIQSALQGGLIGGVFGGAMAPFHGNEPTSTKAPNDVSNQDLLASTAQLSPPNPAGTPQLASPEKMSVPPGASGISDVPTDQIMGMWQPLQDKGASRSAAENLSHVALGQEVAMRTPPGKPLGTDMFSAEDMATRVPQIEALKNQVFTAAPKDAPQLASFNAANEPELVNWLSDKVKAASPMWLKDKAREYGVEVPGDKNYTTPADQLTVLSDQLDKSMEARQAAAEAGNGKAARAANATVIDLQPKIAKLERLADLHDQADRLLQPPAADGALNLLGGAGEAPARTEAEPPAPAGAEPTQPNMLSSQETGAALEAQRAFQNQVAPGLPEGTIKAHDMPTLVNDLKAHLLTNDEINGGDVDKLHPAIKKLMVDTGLIDNRGTNRDLPAEREAAYAKYDALWERAGDKTVPPKDQAAAAQEAQAMKRPGGEIDQIEKLQDLHARADEQPGAPEVPGRVRPALAPSWRALESAKDLRQDSPEANAKIRQIADAAQRSIETNARDAGKRGQFALNQISGLTRARDVSPDLEGGRFQSPPALGALDPSLGADTTGVNKNRPNMKPVGEPLPADIEPNVKAKKKFDKLTKALPAPKEEPVKAPAEPIVAALGGVKRTGRILPDLIEKPAELPKPSSLETRIRQAHNELTGGALNGVSQLKDLRAKLSDVPREDLNKELVKLHEEPDSGIQIGRSDNPMDRSAERDAEGLAYKGELAHQLIANPRPVAEPPKPIQTIKEPPTFEAARAELQALHDKLPEGSPQKDFAAKALAKNDMVKWKSTLRALQLTLGNLFRDEGGSLNFAAIKKSFSKLSDAMKQKVLDKADEPMKPSEQVKFKDMPENKPTTSPQQAEGRIKDTMAVADMAMHAVADAARSARSNVSVALHKAALITESLSGIVRIVGNRLNTAADYRDHRERMEAIVSGKNKADVLAARAYLETPKEGQELVNEALYRLNDGSGLDIRKNLDKSTLLDKNGKLVPNAAELQARHKEGQAIVSRLTQKGYRPVLDGILQMNQSKGYQELAATLSSWGKIWSKTNEGRVLPGHEVNPDEVYQFRSDLHDSVLGTMKFYADSARAMRDGLAKEINDRVEKMNDFLKDNPNDPKKEAKAQAILGDITDLKSALSHANERLIETDRGTYAPLGHGDGDYFVAAKVKTDEEGNQLPGAMAAVQKAFEDAGFHGIGFFHDSDSNQFMTRLEKQTQMERARGILNQLETDGHLMPGETRSGRPDTPTGDMGKIGPKFIQSMVQHINESVDRSGATGDVAKQTKARLISQLMAALPDSSIIPNLQKRNYVSGYSKEMGETSIKRATDSSRASTTTSMGDRTAQVMTAMRKEVEDNQLRTDMSEADKLIGADAHRELMLREVQKGWRQPKNVIDAIRALGHTVSIGANIAYTVLPMSQIFTLSHAELAKKNGFANSAKALGSSATEAFQVMKAMAYGKDRTSLGFRESDMKAGKVSDWATKVVMDLENRGGLSSYTRTMSDLGEHNGSTYERVKGYANMMGSYAETYPRIITALAAAKMHDAALASGKQWAKDIPRGEYIKNVVDESQFRWGGGEASRLTGGNGPLGSFGKLAFAFTQFQTKVIEKLYGEVHDLLSKDSSPELRQEAGRFLASHLIATVALAGSLGLPASGMLAGLYDRLYTKLTGDDNMDIEGSYRTWLSHTFGPLAGDVLAKGLPRAFGVDMSKLGEQHLIPFTRMMQDKRKFEDVTDDWFKSMAGAAVGELGEAYLGARDISNGDYMLGLQKMLPGSLKDAAEAVYLGQHGFINSKGQREPIPATSQAIILKALGFKTAAEAKYDEASEIVNGLKNQRQTIASNISTHLGRAAMMGDSQSLGDWLSAARQFQINHPTVPGPIQSFSRTLQRLQLGQANANAFGLPLGLKPYDPIAGQVGFVNQQ